MRQIEIPEAYMETFETEVKALQIKAEKLHVTPPEYKIIGSKWVELPKKTEDEEVSMAKVFTIEFDEVNVVINGWKVVCRIQKNDSNLVGVRNINNAFYYSYEENIPQECYEKSPSMCEHCGRNIPRRKTTYILRNITTNEYKQVGSSCVHDFVSSTNNIDSILNWISSFTDYVREKSSEKFDDLHHKRYYSVKSFLRLLIKMYSEAGFIPNIPPTHDASYEYPNYYSFDRFLHNHERYDLDPRIEEEIEKILDFCRKSYEELSDKESLSVDENKERNAMVAVLASYMCDEPDYMKEFLRGVSAYYRSFTKQLYNKNNDFLGNVGDIISVRAKLWEMREHRGGTYGDFYIARFVTHDGYKLTSFVSVKNKFASYLKSVHVGHELTFDAKVKSHDEYKGDKTTKINYISNYHPYYCNIKEELGVSS